MIWFQIPVYRGATEPLIIEPKEKDAPVSTHEPYHGVDGFGGAVFAKEPDMSLVQKESAVQKLSELARKHKGNSEKSLVVKN